MSEVRHAVLIASSVFPEDQRLQSLRCPENDIDGICSILTSPVYGLFAENAVLMLKNRPHHEVLLALNRVLQSAKKDDFVLVYYSGHGKPDQAGRLHLATVDTNLDTLGATSVPVESIKSYIDICASNKIVLILDCCFSGAAGDAFLRSDVNQQLQNVSRARGIYIMTASTALQVAQEKEGDRFGVLTKHVIEGITERGADLDGDGLVTMDELYSYVHRRVMEETPQQPEKFAFNVRGDLVLAKTGLMARDERKDRIRKVILEYADKNLIPDSMLTRSIEVLRTSVRELSPEAKRYDDLLDRLYQKRLEIGEFIEDWYRVAAAPSVRQAETALPQPEAQRPGTAVSGGYSSNYISKRTLPKHPRGALCAAFSPGGTFLAVGAGDGRVRLWETNTGKLVAQFEAGEGPVWALRFGKSGVDLVSAGPGNVVRRWNLSTKAIDWEQDDFDRAVLSIDVDEADSLVAAGGYLPNVSVWDQEGKDLSRLPSEAKVVHAVRFSPKGKVLAWGDSERNVKLWNPGTGKMLKVLRGHSHAVLSLAFRQDGSQLASGSRDGQIRLWDTTAWVCQRVLKGHENSILSIAFHPEGDVIVSSSSDNTIRFWSTQNGELLRRAESGHISVSFVVFSQDGSWLASGGADETVRLWQASVSKGKSSSHGV
ncbi:MAG: caspase family protein [Acidobacteriota bacterium]|nr:caspase family protein [Acidobacteriota bacterium]